MDLMSELLQFVERMETPLWNHPMLYIQWGAVLGTSLAAAIIDSRSRRIPNLLTFPAFIGGLIWAGSIGGFAGVLDGIFGCMLLATPFIIMFLFAKGGAGDAKLMGALGTWLGVMNGLVALVAVLIMGAALGLCYAVLQGKGRAVLQRVGELSVSWLIRMRNPGTIKHALAAGSTHEQVLVMPYGICILAGVSVAATVVSLWLS